MASFCFGLATSITATYAWYSLTSVAVVDNLNILINCEDAYLELGMKNDEGEIIYPSGDSYYNKEDIEDSEDNVLGEVSGMFASSWQEGVLDKDNLLPTFRSNYRGATSYKDPGVADSSNYLQVEFYLRCNYDAEIYLSEGSYLRANHDRNVETAAKYPDEHLVAEKLDKGVNATRISFMSIGNDGNVDYHIVSNIERDTKYAGLLDLYGDHYYDYKDGKEILFGEYSGNENDFVYVDNPPISEQEVIEEDDFSTFTAYHAREDSTGNIVKGIDFEASSIGMKEENATPIDELILKEGVGQMSTAPLAKLKANEDKRLIVSIYVEGWDKDMIDSIGRAAIDINVGFVALLK